MLVTAALAYARHGIPVLPVHTPAENGRCSCGRPGCDRPGKHPRLRHGLTDASTDPEQIAAWWTRWPDANIGLRTGVVMDVADIDSTAGWHGLRHLLGGAMPVGPRVRTGGGGWHLWFSLTGYGNRVRLLPGLDWRGSGGYVVAPPSRHASGADYRWLIKPNKALPRVGRALTGLLAGPVLPPPSAGSGRHAFSPPAADPGRHPLSPPAAGSGRHALSPPAAGAGRHAATSAGRIVQPDRYAAAALDAETERVARAPVGARNDTLNRAAFALGRLVAGGMLDAWVVRTELERAARYAGLGPAETRRTIRSGMTAGQEIIRRVA
jgi:hypothetical protein